MPSGYRTTIGGCLHDLGNTQTQFVMEADRCGLARHDRHRLRVRTVAIIELIDFSIVVADFLDPYLTGCQIGNGDITVCIRGVWTGNQILTALIAVDAELPTR